MSSSSVETLLVADNKTGYLGVYHGQPGKLKSYQARVWRGGKGVSLGYFSTAEEAALCVARSPEGKAAAQRAAAAPPLTSEEARQQAQAEGLTLRLADNKSGYSGVCLNESSRPKPYQAGYMRGGKKVHLGSFATAEEAALRIAQSSGPEERAAARRAAAPPLTREEVAQQAQAEGLTLRRVTGNKTGYFGVKHKPGRSKPYDTQVRCGGKQVYLGSFATVEEAALCVARSPEGQAAAERAAAAPAPLASDNGVGDGAGMKEGETETEEEEEEATILDAIEVDPWTATDDDDVVTMPP